MEERSSLLREIPSVDELLRSPRLTEAASVYSRPLVVEALRASLEEVRAEVAGNLKESFTKEEIISNAVGKILDLVRPSIRRVVNATGTILHTNIGRALLCEEALDAVRLAGKSPINLEFDIRTGKRGERDSHVEGLLKRLTGAEAATVVNNNSAAVLLTLNTLAEGGEVIISRGELIEIGGSFRLPEIIRKSGCILREVGTTNRTHPGDYEGAVGGETAIIFKAHRSNYDIVGFTAEVGLKDLVSLGKKRGLPVVEDLGSGSLVDLTRWGLPHEPVVRESVEDGADAVTFSGDKLLGGPQAGIIVGRKDIIDKINRNPLKRALRVDKLTLSALEATLLLYLNPERLPEKLPALKLMTRDVREIEENAGRAQALLIERLGKDFTVSVEDGESVIGGGSLPGHNMPTKVISITNKGLSPENISRIFLESDPPILGRIKKDRFLLDMRTVERPEDVVPGGAFL